MKKASAGSDRRGQTQVSMVALCLHHLLLHGHGVWVFAVGCSWGCRRRDGLQLWGQHPSQGKMALGASLSHLLLSRRVFKQNIANLRAQRDYLLADTNDVSRINELQN